MKTKIMNMRVLRIIKRKDVLTIESINTIAQRAETIYTF